MFLMNMEALQMLQESCGTHHGIKVVILVGKPHAIVFAVVLQSTKRAIK